jgi:hypothetical protein
VRYLSFQYQAASWDSPRRVIAKVEHHLGELFPRVGFIVITLTGTNRAVARFYNQRETTEQWIKEGKEAPIGPASPVPGSGPMRCVCSWVPSPTISAISCADLSYPWPSRAGR